MANVSTQTTRGSGATSNYAKKDAVAISAVNATVPRFEQRLQQIRGVHGKDGVRAKELTDGDGKIVRDEAGDPVIARDSKGNIVYEGKYVQAYSMVESFGHDELHPDDPQSWEKAQVYGRALAEEVAPGHPALVATEVNGRSGCVHNHIIIGATDPETGKQLDSNVVTHARLAVMHDRVLAENGFEQRSDMREVAADAADRMEQVRQKVIAEDGDALSPSALQRRILAAENTVQLRSYAEVVAERHGQQLSPEQKKEASAQSRQDRRQREFERHAQTERDRGLAIETGIAPPKQKFSEVELEARVRDALSDPRATSWEELSEVGPEHGVTVERRGKDVSYGMILADADGVLQEPARAHRRRGKSLGEGFRVEDVETSLERNAELVEQTRAPQPPRQSTVSDIERLYQDRIAPDLAEHEEQARQQQLEQQAQTAHVSESEPEPAPAPRRRYRSAPQEQQAVDPEAQRPTVATEPEQPSVAAPAAQPVPAPVEEGTFLSGLRGVTAKNGSEKIQQRIDTVAELEEDYRDRRPDKEFEDRLSSVGVGQQFMDHYGEHLGDQMRGTLDARQESSSAQNEMFEDSKQLDGDDFWAAQQRRGRMRAKHKDGDYTGAAALRSRPQQAQATEKTNRPAHVQRARDQRKRNKEVSKKVKQQEQSQDRGMDM